MQQASTTNTRAYPRINEEKRRIEVWSVALDQCIGTVRHLKDFRKAVTAHGWTPIQPWQVSQ